MACSSAKQLFELLANRGIVRPHRRQNAWMVEASTQSLLQVAAFLHDASVSKRVQAGANFYFLPQSVEFLQNGNIFIRNRFLFSVSQDFNQRNFKRRDRNDAIERKTMPLPLPLDSGIA